jgi:predicted KAP-like P-loop ATPase
MQTLSFSDDMPRDNPWTDDRLGYRPFAKRVSEAILGCHAPNGYVVGLHGTWGSGKTTLINFVKAYIEKHNVELQSNDGALAVIDFNPWIVSGHLDLISAFFKVLAEALNPKAPSQLRWKRRWLKAVRLTTDPLLSAAATIGVAFDPTIGVGSRAASEIAKKSLANSVDRWLAEPSMQAAYKTLRTQLATKRRRFLIVIDDIDRLQRDEIRSIMQMVKTVGRLPNVIYLWRMIARSYGGRWIDMRQARPRSQGSSKR